MRPQSSAIDTLRWILVGLGLALPLLSMVPLGSLWLWQNGYLLHWAFAACICTVIAWVAQRWLLGPARSLPVTDVEPAADTATAGDATWTPAERKAWQSVQTIAKAVEPETLKSRGDILELGSRTVAAVARAIHPGRVDALLEFTAPEALALVERVSGRMHHFVRDNVPLGDRLTLAQMRTLYGWKGSIELAEQAWAVWRVLRALNPATALANEVRERVSKELMAWGKAHIARRLATVFVEEVGRAAIDLYGGRLRVPDERLASYVSSGSARDLVSADESARLAMAEPLRLLVSGQVSAGKSSLVNALGQEVRAAVDALPATADFTPYRLQREGLPTALIVDSPGLVAGADLDAALIEEAGRADLVLWVVAAHRADREIDRAALQALRGHFEGRPDRRAPPVLLVLTHVDRLRPFQEWSPPYDLADPVSAKAASIRAAVEAAASDLGFTASDVIPCCLSDAIAHYNVDALWAAIHDRLPEAQRTRLVRTLRDAQGAWDWQRIWAQAKSGGRVLARSIRS